LPREFRFELFQADVPGNIDEFVDEDAGQAFAADRGMDDDADTADVTFPAAERLVREASATILSPAKATDREDFGVIDFRGPIPG